MDIYELKRNWNNLCSEGLPTPDVKEMENRVVSHRVTTLLQRMYKIHLRLGIVAAIGNFTMVPFAKEHPLMVACAFAFFILMAILHLSLAFRVKKLDYSTMTVKEALESVYKLESRRNRNRVIGISLALPLCCFMAYTFAHTYDPSILWGCLVGAVLGAIIGFIINHKASMMLREMKSQLLSIDN
ncbi:MAG: hypothetical protein NC221_06990 [Duncaniella sp.]|nr:hypothetical protein [Duncaniella sp.]